jgi:hypothetical protein
MTASSFGSALRDWLNGLGKHTTADFPDVQLLQRFLQERDESAFAQLMQRHGPLVLGVCRHLLHDQHDADDAFQATFLVLACRAASIRCADSLSSFLYGPIAATWSPLGIPICVCGNSSLARKYCVTRIT